MHHHFSRRSDCQHTIAQSISYVGASEHSGQLVTMGIHPAAADKGIRLMRADIDTRHSLRANWQAVTGSDEHVVLGDGHDVHVRGMEHVLAALHGSGIDNAVVEVNADETPGLKGNCEQLLSMIRRAGLRAQDAPRLALFIERPIEVEQGGSHAVLMPANVPGVTVLVADPEASGKWQRFAVESIDAVFEPEIATGRSFGTHRQSGPAQGPAGTGSLHTSVFLDGGQSASQQARSLNNEDLRNRVLDCLGDLALAGAPIVGHLYTTDPNHRLLVAMMCRLFAERDAWSWLTNEQLLARTGHAVSVGAARPEHAVLNW